MKSILFEQVASKEFLAVITDQDGQVIWKSAKSPVSTLYTAYFHGEFSASEPYILHADQAGMAMGILASKLNIVECHAVKMTGRCIRLLEACGVEFDYREEISMVRSSKNADEFCPIDLYLSAHASREEQWDFLAQKFNGDGGAHSSCAWRPEHPQ